MRRNITVKSLTILFFLTLFLYLLYPTVKFNYLLTKADKEELKIHDPITYQDLFDKSIKLGLDLQGGMKKHGKQLVSAPKAKKAIL